jgi:hypothetical protein
VHLSPELAVAMIAALASLWQVYVAKQSLAGLSKKSAMLPKSNFGTTRLFKKIYSVVDDAGSFEKKAA